MKQPTHKAGGKIPLALLHDWIVLRVMRARKVSRRQAEKMLRDMRRKK